MKNFDSVFRKPLEAAFKSALAYLENLDSSPAGTSVDLQTLRNRLDRPLTPQGVPAEQVVSELIHDVEGGIIGSAGGRFFGWVIGGTLPAALAADWLTSAWDQNAGSSDGSPAAAAIDHVALRWVAELLDLPARSGALVTGAQMANFVGLAVARAEVLRVAGWDLDRDGLAGAPAIEVSVGGERHSTIDRALRLLGIGTRQLRVVDADREGRLCADRLDLSGDGPLIVCAQAGNVNGGAFDPLPAIAERVTAARARRPVWLHVDGAFGLWARVAPRRRALANGAELADSWATDA